MKLRILGAGVMGLTIATELQARGHQIEIVDPALGAGPQACSWWAGGMLAPYCEAESADPCVIPHGLAAIDWWQRHTDAVQTHGTLVVSGARDRADLSRFARRSQGHQRLDAAQIAALEPDLGGRFASALFYPTEAHLSPRSALQSLQSQLTAGGAMILAGPSGQSVDLEIDARGLAARDALPDLRGVRGEMLVLRCPDITLSRPVRLLHPRIPLYIVPRGDGIYMLGATMIESDRRGIVSARSVMELLSAAWTLHPAFGEAEILEMGADARPAFPDNLPRLRRHGPRLYANGLYRHGFLLSPPVACMAADHIEHGTIPPFMED